jgi:hypothetical protein
MTHLRRIALLGLTLATVHTPTALAARPPQSAAPLTGPETHPPGDIPDAQAFVRYTAASGGYSLEVPEGWARRNVGRGVSFSSKLNRVELMLRPAQAVPSLAAVRAGVLASLTKADPGLRVTLLRTVQLPAGPAILARFTSAGAANEVTGRKETLENDLYVLRHGPRELVLRLSAPLGSDNGDAWTRMARSLAWK